MPAAFSVYLENEAFEFICLQIEFDENIIIIKTVCVHKLGYMSEDVFLLKRDLRFSSIVLKHVRWVWPDWKNILSEE